MSELKDLIRQYPELGEAFAQFENRVSYLENCQHSHEPEEPQPKEKDIPWVSSQWDTIKQIRAMILFLQGKLNEHVDASKKKSQGKY